MKIIFFLKSTYSVKPYSLEAFQEEKRNKKKKKQNLKQE